MSKFKHIFLGIAIAIVFVFFVGFGIGTFYESPKYEDFCEERFFSKPFPIREAPNDFECKEAQINNFNFEKECRSQDGDVIYDIDDNGCSIANECTLCRKEYEDVREVYNRNVFIAAVGIGIIVLIIGFALHMPSVSSGLMGGGILTIIYGTIRFWGDLPDYGRFIILGITLIILIWLGYKKLKK